MTVFLFERSVFNRNTAREIKSVHPVKLGAKEFIPTTDNWVEVMKDIGLTNVDETGEFEYGMCGVMPYIVTTKAANIITYMQIEKS